MKFGFIGAGNMAGAIIKGMTIGTRSFDGKDIRINSKTMTTAEKLAAECGAAAATAEEAAACDVLVLAVKPHVLASVVPPLQETIAAKKPLVVSIAAGKTLSYLEELLPEGTPIVRVMPNINAKIGAATSGMCKNEQVTAEQEALVRQIFETIGTVISVEESQFGIFTVLAGSAPAFAYLYMDALARAAVKAGMSKQQALTIAAATVEGSAKMILKSGEHPMALVDQVCSPGGTTIEGIAALQNHGFEATLTAAFDAVLEKDQRIGKKN
ncbi:MAG: pyrroline-5-carboxylate reductase [Bacillota bacterium]|nr:pyrroline-5-carboxylate reductase [Bacillota bacterium]